MDACADVSTDEELLEALESIIEPYRDRSSKLVQVLAEAQQRIGYLPKWVQERVAKGPGLSLQGVYGVVTFYAYFCLISKGRHKVCVCTRTACYVKGSNIETVRCIGACGLVPAMN